MRLRNKKTGEIGELQTTEKHYAVVVGNGTANCNVKVYCSLAKLNENWEDYEEPKGFWSISADATIEHYDRLNENDRCKEIGNYFDTREQAEQAVEKLKAWKRLKDKGFRFIDHIDRDSGQGMTRYEWDGYVNGEDLDLLFGGEE